MLGNVHSLNLNCCINIIDVSALGNVHILYLNFCNGIKDVYMLGNVHTLNLYDSRNISIKQIEELKKTVKILQY